MVDRTDKLKIPLKFAIHAALYNEFCCNQFHDTAPLKLMLGAFDWGNKAFLSYVYSNEIIYAGALFPFLNVTV